MGCSRDTAQSIVNLIFRDGDPPQVTPRPKPPPAPPVKVNRGGHKGPHKMLPEVQQTVLDMRGYKTREVIIAVQKKHHKTISSGSVYKVWKVGKVQ